MSSEGPAVSGGGREIARPNYDQRPCVAVSSVNAGTDCVAGWDAIASRLRETAADGGAHVVVVDCYVGVRVMEVCHELSRRLQPALVVHSREAFRPAQEIDRLVEPFLGGDDPLFGYLCGLTMDQFLDPPMLAALRHRVEQAEGLVLVVGEAATAVHPGHTLVYADMPRWEGQLRQRRDEVGNLGVDNRTLHASLQYKRSYFVDWRVCDRWKKPLLERADFFLDTTLRQVPKLAQGQAVRRGLYEAAHRPLRLVPFFDPGPWGGQWLRRVCGLDGYNHPEPPNYAWCFDCVPEENSLLLGLGEHRFELPSVNLVYRHPHELLGDPVHARFGDEFPIRFDFLDTLGGGNLSLQVHPPMAQIRQAFGLPYTQDESYYLMDAGEGACVYLGLREGVDAARMFQDLHRAQAGGALFDAERYVNRFPAKAHDHFLIPAGTIHCSGRNSVVLEISATPYIFTFKLWDWARLGLDGRPRPLNIERGRRAIQWERTTSWVTRELINRIEDLAVTEGWREQRTGLHELQFIETRRHWFTGPVPHDTGGTTAGGVHVLNLVQGREAVVESPEGAFPPFVVHYAETFIVPAAVGRYTIRPPQSNARQPCATIKASVRRGSTEPSIETSQRTGRDNPGGR
ncbi:MAG: class I mannose-6-phosphate isomerase [Phycisphaeraceae bacterium]|nr:class I mannose-6-phosphate isomerase [Phycisphaeraceae bacterium]